ncbi:VCP-like ATPase [uncultured archaeon]|nr:VCP-like ATPase [uncultured archaeon]
MDMNEKNITLKVSEALQNDIGRGIVRVDSKVKKELNLATGDFVKLSGKKSTIAIVWQSHPEDEGLDLVRMDGIIRQNTGIGLGDKIKLEKVEVKEAKKLTLAPKEAMRYSPGFDQYVKRKLIGKGMLKGNILPVGVFGTAIPLVVSQVVPQSAVVVTENTEVIVKNEPLKELENIPTVTYDDIGGLQNAIQKIREMVELPLRHPELFERLGIEPPKGVLLYGAPGTGKTLLAKAVANESDASFFYIGGPEVVSKFVGESEEKIRKIFKEAEEGAPSIIFIDEVDAIAPKRGEATGEVEKRMVSQLLTLMDGLKSRGQVIVIAATNRPDSIDEALRRPGRFDREIEIGVPDREGRHEIMQIHTRNMPLDKGVDIKELANVSHGYTGADLSSLTKEAAIKSLRRILPEINLDEEFIPPEILDRIKVTQDDFFSALREIQPSALREFYIEKPNIKWDEVGGLETVKRDIMEAVDLPLKRPEVFENMGIRPIKGILFYGPPGTGKTLLAKAAATESEANFIAIKGSDLLSKWVGESAKQTRELFRKARQAAPCIIFIDEIDSIGMRRAESGYNGPIHDDVLNGILVEMDGLRALKNVVGIAATNRPNLVDPALLRAGRFDKMIEVPVLDRAARLEILKIHVRKMPLEKVDLKGLADATEGFTGADLQNLSREAAMIAIRECAKKVSQLHFEKALKAVIPGVKKEDIESMEKFRGAVQAMYR